MAMTWCWSPNWPDTDGWKRRAATACPRKLIARQRWKGSRSSTDAWTIFDRRRAGAVHGLSQDHPAGRMRHLFHPFSNGSRSRASYPWREEPTWLRPATGEHSLVFALLPTSLSTAPETVVRYVATQLDVDPAELAGYGKPGAYTHRSFASRSRSPQI